MTNSQKVLIVLIIGILIITGTLAFFILKNQKKQNQQTTTNQQGQTTSNHNGQTTKSFTLPEAKDGEIATQYAKTTTTEKKEYMWDTVKVDTEYFTVSQFCQKYVTMADLQNTNAILPLLSPSFIKEKNITEQNIWQYVEIPKLENKWQSHNVLITQMLGVEIENGKKLYSVNATIRTEGSDVSLFSLQLLFMLDSSNRVYCIYPYAYLKEHGLANAKIGDKLPYVPNEEIEKNTMNQFKYILKEPVEVTKAYFENFKEKIRYYPDELYKQLDQEYAQKRFGSKEQWDIYLKDNVSTLALMNLDRYKITNYEDYTQFVCIDQFANVYVLKQQGGVMNYTVVLDDYTLPTEQDMQEYSKLSDIGKCSTIVKRFVKQINTKDYNTIYVHLDVTFQQNNFPTIENLRAYIKENLGDAYSVEINDGNKKDGHFVYEVTLKNLRYKQETKKMTVILDLKEDQDYTMSFSIK